MAKFNIAKATKVALDDVISCQFMIDAAVELLIVETGGGCPDDIDSDLSEYYDCAKCMSNLSTIRDPKECWKEWLALKAEVV